MNHIAFIDNQNKNNMKFNLQTLHLLDIGNKENFLDLIPRNFSISSNNRTHYFNLDILKIISPVIAYFNAKNPQNSKYNLDIDDERNVLGKIEQIYQGKSIIFDECDLPIAEKITKFLKINNYFELVFKSNEKIEIEKWNLYNFFKRESFITFTIITNKNRYKCNIYGIYASKVIRDFLSQNPSKKEYEYDYDDDFGEFQLICDIFNFKEVKITVHNMNSLKEMVDQLNIEIISQKIEDYIKMSELISNRIDDHLDEIDSIDELFDWLYHIDEKTVNSVKNSILNSNWCQTEEDVQELAAFILQVVDTNIFQHNNLAELILQLSNEANETNQLKILIPFIVKNLMLSFGKSSSNCSFIFNLYKRDIISKDELFYQLNRFFKTNDFLIHRRCHFNNYISYCEFNSKDSKLIHNLSKSTTDLYLWFLPELIECNLYSEKFLKVQNEIFLSFIKSFLPDRIEEYKQMRDKGEPDDEITKALRSDDVDRLQLIMSTNQNSNTKLVVPFNIFENFVPNGKTNYLNYSAAYGSVKCFKFLLLNHQSCDDLTFAYAVYGGNIEIIKIVDQSKIEINTIEKDLSDYFFYSYYEDENDEEEEEEEDKESRETLGVDSDFDLSNYRVKKSLVYKILPSIAKHQNDLFDWIFEQKFKEKDLKRNLLNRLLINSARNGNIHSIISIIDKEFNLSGILFEEVIKIACENGFFRLSKIIFDLFKVVGTYDSRNVCSFVCFGNLSIFINYFNNYENHKKLENAFLISVVKDHRNIIDFIFDTYVKDGFQISGTCIFNSLNISVMRKSGDLFFYLLNQFKQMKPYFNINDFTPTEILSNACVFGNFGAVKVILESINISNHDFTDELIKAAATGSSEICQYFLDKKVSIDYNRFSTYANDLSSLNEEVFSKIIDNCNHLEKEQILRFTLKAAIDAQNHSLVEYLLKENAYTGNSLFKAVLNNDLKMVNIILKYRREPSFVNRTSPNGTALCIAVKLEQLQIIKALLSIPGINPALGDYNDNKPLMLAFPNAEIIGAILDFYGENFLYQTDQINFLLSNTINLLFSNKSEAYPIFIRILEINNIPLNLLFQNENFLTFACRRNDVDVAMMLLKLENINLNVYIPDTGETPLIIAIKEGSNEVAELLIKDHRTNINARNYRNETALAIAVSNSNYYIIDLLLNDEKFNPIESLLDKVFFDASDEVKMKIISTKSFDINHKLINDKYQKHHNYASSSFTSNSNEYNDSNFSVYENSYEALYSYSDSYLDFKELNSSETILQYAVRHNKQNIVDFVIQSPFFDKEKSCLEEAITSTIKENNFIIFKKLSKLVIDDEIDLLSIAIQENSEYKIINEILNDPNYDSQKNNIFDKFCMNLHSLDVNSYETMFLLYKFDKKHVNLIDLNKLSTDGETVFTSICLNSDNEYNLTEVINFLLKNGADPNVPNKRGKYPLQHAIELNSITFVLALIDSNKIDFSIRMNRINNKSYLHLAAMSNEISILKVFLERNLIDINVTDNQDETPLIDACKFNRINNVSLMFTYENLDYLHCNSQGKDALKIVQDPWHNYFSLINNKKRYYNELIYQLRSRNGLLYGSNHFDKNSGKIQKYLSSSQIKEQKQNSNSSSSFKFESESHLPPLNKNETIVFKKPEIPNKIQLPPLKSDSAVSPRLILNKVADLQNKSEKGDANAQYSLGVCYALGTGVSMNKEKAFEWYLKAAELGHMNAQYAAAACYSYGKGTEINKSKAFELYLQAAEKGFDKAQFAVAHFYHYGEGGIKRNIKKAVEWYQKAADQGHKGSIEALKFKQNRK